MFLADKLNKGGSLGGYQISRSLRFNSADSAYLNRTPASASNRTTWTWSGWVKRSSFGTDQQLFSAGGSGAFQFLYQTSTDCLYIYDSVSSTTAVITTQVFRDPSAWYHVVLATDTTQATASNRFKLYINGSQVTSFGTATYPAQNSTLSVNNTVNHSVGSWSGAGGGNFFSGYMTEVNFIDGSQLTPSSFGETNAQTGVWQPKAYSGSYGTNGFYLNFSDNSNTTAATLGKDYSGNGNNWTPNNFSVTAGIGNDSLVDSPTSYGTTDTGVGGEIRGNYCTWNPVLQADFWASPVGKQTLTNGNLDASGNGQAAFTTFEIPNNLKVYYEITWSSIGSEAAVLISAASRDTFELSYLSNGQKELTGNTRSSYGASWTNGDIIGVAIDRANNTATFYKNGTSQGAITNTFPSVTVLGGIYGGTSSVNFGQRPFAYTAPSGYKALCTQNLPTPTIGATTATQAGKYFNPVLWTSTGTTQSITGVGFQPDFVWSKPRNSVVSNYVNDAVRGTSKYLITNGTNTEGTDTQFLTSFDSDGFTYGTSQFSNGNTMVSWNWKANGSGSTNTSGSITSTVSANTTSGFSVVTYTGTGSAATIGHGLGVAPSMLIFKSRSSGSENWNVYHKSLGTSNNILLNTSGAAFNDTAFINNTAPTSSVLSVGGAGSTGTNQGSGTYVCYAFAEVAGYSKFGSYTGNGSSTGPFVYCGFRPAWVLIKNTTSSGPQWWILDDKRNVYNPEDLALPTSLAYAEQTIPTCLNFLSNGFQVTTTNGDFNTSGSNYIFMAIAENPFKYSLAR